MITEEQRIKKNEKSRLWRLKNPERQKFLNHSYKYKNKEKLKIYSKQYAIDNKEKIKKYNLLHQDKRKFQIRQYKQTHKEEEKIRYRKWCDLNRDKLKGYNNTYRKNNKELRNKLAKKYVEKYPLKKHARDFAHNHLKQLQPNCCEICGSQERLEMHHPDYNLYEIVMTLCNACHNKITYFQNPVFNRIKTIKM